MKVRMVKNYVCLQSALKRHIAIMFAAILLCTTVMVLASCDSSTTTVWGPSSLPNIYYRFSNSLTFPHTWMTDRIDGAASTWRTSTNGHCKFVYNVQTNGVNDNYWEWGNAGVGNLATTYPLYYSPSGYLKRKITSYNNDDNIWADGMVSNKYDFGSIARHEFGHWFFLSDLTDPNCSGTAIMYGQFSKDLIYYITTVDVTSANSMYP